MAQAWLLLIYTVPAKPTSKRAFIWREIRKAGAVYLRDGVCALPAAEEPLRAFQAIAAKVEELEGDGVLVEHCELPAQRSEALIDQMAAARVQEYGDLIRQATLLTQHMEREREHRPIHRSEFADDLGKLSRWLEQIKSRDYFDVPQARTAQAVLGQCGERLTRLVSLTTENTTS